MKIAFKYGLPITLVLVVWILVVRLWMGVGPNSSANILAPILFNLAAILFIYLGISKRKSETGVLSFKQGLKTGMAISLVYAASACLFFVVEFLVAGPKLLMSEVAAPGGTPDRPLWQVAALAYAGLFFGSLIFGLIYSTIISFVIARRRT